MFSPIANVSVANSTLSRPSPNRISTISLTTGATPSGGSRCRARAAGSSSPPRARGPRQQQSLSAQSYTSRIEAFFVRREVQRRQRLRVLLALPPRERKHDGGEQLARKARVESGSACPRPPRPAALPPSPRNPPRCASARRAPPAASAAVPAVPPPGPCPDRASRACLVTDGSCPRGGYAPRPPRAGVLPRGTRSAAAGSGLWSGVHHRASGSRAAVSS